MKVNKLEEDINVPMSCVQGVVNFFIRHESGSSLSNRNFQQRIFEPCVRAIKRMEG